MNWYEERKFREETKKKAEEAAARDTELAAMFKACSKMVDARLKDVYKRLAEGTNEL